jgi:fumarate reductase subunit C
MKPGRGVILKRKPRYHTPLTHTWFLERRGFQLFMLREGTAIPIIGYIFHFIFWLNAFYDGPETFAAMMETLRHPTAIALHAIALPGALYHSITWFNLTPKIMPMYIGEDRMPDSIAAIAMGYGPWLAVTAAMLWFSCAPSLLGTIEVLP